MPARPSSPTAAARAAGLVHSTDDHPGLRRVGRPGRFSYADARGRRIRDPGTLDRLRRLAIPPAWTSVWINPDPRGHVQASGRDARGRKQYRYHPAWAAWRDAAKFDQLPAFALALPRLRRAVAAALRRPALDRERVAAVIVRLLEVSLVRVGNEEYARTNHSYGLTTLRSRHARVRRGRVELRFAGKSGVRHHVVVAEPALARLVRRIQDLPGQDLFQYLDEHGRRRHLKSDHVNAFIRAHAGADFTAKHFRTWAGTVLMALELARLGLPPGTHPPRRALADAVRAVAARLGNTPAVARRSYIHPALMLNGVAGDLAALGAARDWPPPRPRRALTPEERAVLRVLRRASRPLAAQLAASLRAPRRRPAARRRHG